MPTNADRAREIVGWLSVKRNDRWPAHATAEKALEVVGHITDALDAAEARGRRAALEEAAKRADAWCRDDRLRQAYDKPGDAIRALLREVEDEGPSPLRAQEEHREASVGRGSPQRNAGSCGSSSPPSCPRCHSECRDEFNTHPFIPERDCAQWGGKHHPWHDERSEP